MNDIQTVWQATLYIFSSIAVIGVGISWIKKVMKPYEDLKKIMGNHERMLANQQAIINEMKKSCQLQCEVILSIIDFQLTDDDEEKQKLKDKRKEIEDYLINR